MAAHKHGAVSRLKALLRNDVPEQLLLNVVKACTWRVAISGLTAHRPSPS